MADAADNDMLMFFELTPNAPIASESRSARTGSGKGLMDGFLDGKYFEVESFSFNMELHDDETSNGATTSAKESRSYARWRVLEDGQPIPSPPFRAEPSDASVTRMIDSSSPILLQHCLNTKRFHRAVLVKRVRLGATGNLVGVFRLEFADVWLKAVEWEDGDAIKESLKFKFSSVRVVYVRRNLDGTLASPTEHKWTAPQVTTT